MPAKMGLDWFLTEGPFKEWFHNAKIVHKAACMLNFYTCIMNPVEGNIVVVGDAAAFIETYCQSALMYGYLAAQAALKVQSTGKGYDDYTNFWRKALNTAGRERSKEPCRPSVWGNSPMTRILIISLA